MPGTVATARRLSGRVAPLEDFHAVDHWYRLEADLPGDGRLEFGGLATLAELWLDDVLVATSRSMFVPLTVRLPPQGASRLEMCFRALRPALALRLPGRRPRWRNRLTADENLRGHRTTLLGHMPGWSGDTAVVGPFRPVFLHEPVQDAPLVERADLRARLLPDGTGLVSVRLEGAGLDGRGGTLVAAGRAVALSPCDGGLGAELTVPDPPLWWPHTHGAPTTCAVIADIGGHTVGLGRIGFRSIERRDPADGFGLVVNGVPVFARGAVWAGLDATGEPGAPEALAAALRRAQQAGFNMLRVTGMTTYETPEFFERCDELGILVWHDFMFARFDYPDSPEFVDAVRAEASAFLDLTQAHPSLAVLCGGTEVAQAAAMAGCRPELWHMPLFESVLAEQAAAIRPDVPFVAHSPLPRPADGQGGGFPSAAAAPIAHYFGVGAYQRATGELEAAGVRFASECLAFANLPAPASCRDDTGPSPLRAVVRDIDAGWDFGDVRDYYTERLFGLSAIAMRRQDPDNWMELGRAAIALVMQETLATWRTDGRCAGALVLMLQDVVPGTGWGIVGSDGRPKSGWYALRGVCQPIQVLLRDLGQNGVVLHAINETATALRVRLGLRGLSRDGVVEVLGYTDFALEARQSRQVSALALVGRWRDIANAWRFGPPAFVALGATLDDADTGARLSEVTHFPAGPTLPRVQPMLTARLSSGQQTWSVEVSARGFAQFVQVDDDKYSAADGYFHLWPGESRVVPLHPRPTGDGVPGGTVSALNAHTPAHYGMAA